MLDFTLLFSFMIVYCLVTVLVWQEELSWHGQQWLLHPLLYFKQKSPHCTRGIICSVYAVQTHIIHSKICKWKKKILIAILSASEPFYSLKHKLFCFTSLVHISDYWCNLYRTFQDSTGNICKNNMVRRPDTDIIPAAVQWRLTTALEGRHLDSSAVIIVFAFCWL